MKTPPTKAIFRKFKDGGDIIAIFPEDLGTNTPNTCSSYMSVGQHSSCDPWLIIDATTPATPKEYRELARELRQIGYRLDIRKRTGQADLQHRKNELARMKE